MDMDMSGMDMGGMDMGMGGMDMGSGVPSLFYLQQVYWAMVGAVIAAFFLVNVYTKVLCWQRYLNSFCSHAALIEAELTVIAGGDRPPQPQHDHPLRSP